MLRTSAIQRTAPDARPKPAKGPRTVKCKAKGCLHRVIPGADPWCSLDCGVLVALAAGAARKAKLERATRAAKMAERSETKIKLEKYKPLAYWLAKTERACNKYIRARDPDICISCGATYSSAWQAGHYIAVGANSTLRFQEDNIHKQCIKCNMFEGSNAIPYRAALLEKIGPERLEWLERWHSPIKMTREAAEEIEEHYKAKLRAVTNSLKDAL